MKCKAYLSLRRLTCQDADQTCSVCITGLNHNSDIFFACFKTSLHHCPLTSSPNRVAETLVVLIYARHPAMQVSFGKDCCVVLRPLQSFVSNHLWQIVYIRQSNQVSVWHSPLSSQLHRISSKFSFHSGSILHTRTTRFQIIQVGFH